MKKAAIGRVVSWRESVNSEIVCVSLIRKVSASLKSMTTHSYVFHPLPQGHSELGPFLGNHPWQKGVASSGKEEGRKAQSRGRGVGKVYGSQRAYYSEGQPYLELLWAS